MLTGDVMGQGIRELGRSGSREQLPGGLSQWGRGAVLGATRDYESREEQKGQWPHGAWGRGKEEGRRGREE